MKKERGIFNMGMLAASVFSFMLMILSMLIQLGLFLIRHFEMTNSLLASILVQLLTINIDINSTFRWLMFFGVLIVCLIIQGVFKIGRIAFAIFSICVAGILGYMWKTYDSRTAQLTAVTIWMSVVGLLNYFSCSMNKVAA